MTLERSAMRTEASSAWFGAWFHAAWVIASGYAIIASGWTYSLPFRTR